MAVVDFFPIIIVDFWRNDCRSSAAMDAAKVSAVADSPVVVVVGVVAVTARSAKFAYNALISLVGGGAVVVCVPLRFVAVGGSKALSVVPGPKGAVVLFGLLLPLLVLLLLVTVQGVIVCWAGFKL